MKVKTLWLVVSCVMIVATLLASCGKTATPTTSPTTTPTTTTPTTTPNTTPATTPTTKPATTPTTAPPTTTAATPSKLASKTPKYGGTISIYIDNDILHTDKYYFDNTSEMWTSMWMEQLGIGDWGTPRTDFPFQSYYVPFKYVKGMLAENWEMPDQYTYIFHIRKGVHWFNKPPMNGRELTAEDIAYGWRRQIGLGSGYTKPNPNISMTTWNYITSIEVPDKYTVVFKTTKPNSMLLEYLLNIGDNDQTHAREVIEQYGNMEDWHNTTGTGAFMLKDVVRGASYTFEKNPDYWGYDEKFPQNKLPYADEAKLLVIIDFSTRLAAMRTGKLSVINDLTWEQKDSLLKTNPELQYSPWQFMSLSLAPRCDQGPTKDIRVRKAMNMAIDRASMTKNLFGGNAIEWGGFMGPAAVDIFQPLNKYSADVQEGYTYNPAKAKALLAEAGYPNGFEITQVEYTGRDLAPYEVVQSYMAAVGIKYNIKVVDYATRSAIVYNPKGEYGTAIQYTTHSAMPDQCLNYFYDPIITYNYGRVNDPAFIALVDQYRGEFDAAKRTALYNQCDRYAVEHFWDIMLPAQKYYNFWQPWIGGYSGEVNLGQRQYGVIYWRVWVDQDVQKAYGH